MSEEIEYKLKEILKQIEEKRRLIRLTQLMAGCPRSEGGMSYESAAKTIQLFHKDIIELEKEYKRIEPFGESINTSNITQDLRESIEKEQDSPPKVEEKYKREKLRYSGIYNNLEKTREEIHKLPKLECKEIYNKYKNNKKQNNISYLIIIILVLISTYFIINNENKSQVNSKQNINIIPLPTPTTEIIQPTPISAPTPISTPITNKYIDDKGNLHEIVNGYDKIIDSDRSITESQNKQTLQDTINQKYITESGIVGSWKFENGNGWLIYTFNKDGSATFDNSMVGKLYYSYTISDTKIDMTSKDQKTFDGKPTKASDSYRFENSNNLILTIMGYPINFVKIEE